MPTTKGDVEIYYETRGPSDGTPLLFTQGFTWQMIGAREEFIQKFVDAGAYFIMYDNRDVGLSQKFGGQEDYDGGYSLHDMARDGIRVLDDLSLESAHIAGASMGGMISQIMALEHRSRVRSLNLIYTAPAFDMKYFIPQGPEDPMDMAKRLTRDEHIADFVEKERISSSTAFPFDEEWARELGARKYDRFYGPEGILRQAVGISRWQATPEKLGDLNMPSSIIHGRADQRITIEAAYDLDRYLNDAEFHIFPGLGHEIPRELWDEFVAIIMRTASRA